MSKERIRLELKTSQGTPLTIDYADYLAEFFFRANASSCGPNAYDDWIQQGADPNRITAGDVSSVNQTMAARTSYKHWTAFTETGAGGAELQLCPARVVVSRLSLRGLSAGDRVRSWPRANATRAPS